MTLCDIGEVRNIEWWGTDAQFYVRGHHPFKTVFASHTTKLAVRSTDADRRRRAQIPMSFSLRRPPGFNNFAKSQISASMILIS